MKTRKRLIILSTNIGSLAFSFVLIEIILRLASIWIVEVNIITRPLWASTDQFTAAIVDDDHLGKRGNPKRWDHDTRGFRNSSALHSAKIVALGDSHTYGTSVNPKESWPSVLSARLSEDVYNMGLGGYGPAHNNENLSIVAELKPKIIVFGLYFGNDFYEDFRFAQRNENLSKYATEVQLAKITKLENQRTIADELGFLFRRGPQAKRHSSQSVTFRSFGISRVLLEFPRMDIKPQ